MDALVAGVTGKLEALEAALYGLKQVNGRFTTEDGLVTAEVNSDGALVALTLDEAITTLAPTEAAAVCAPFRVIGGVELRACVRALGERLLAAGADPVESG